MDATSVLTFWTYTFLFFFPINMVPKRDNDIVRISPVGVVMNDHNDENEGRRTWMLSVLK